MRVGLAVRLAGPGPSASWSRPSWSTIEPEVRAVDAAGFDLLVLEDGFMGEAPGVTVGFWESVAVAGAIAQATSRVDVAHSMLNTPYRSPALVAHIATTLDEISAGRYILGLGAGNTSDDDYAAAGVPADHRYSRFAEALEVIHSLLKDGAVDFSGRFVTVEEAELKPRGPRPDGPPIVVGALQDRMKELTARFADGWNGLDSSVPQRAASFRGELAQVDRACEAVGRDPMTLSRSLEIFVDAGSVLPGAPRSAHAEFMISGSTADMAEQLLEFEDVGVGEVRCYLVPLLPPAQRAEAAEAMAPILQIVGGAS